MFENRKEAGKLLVKKLLKFKNSKDVIVLGITRGGVVVAWEISEKLNVPFEIIVIKKIGAPLNPELAIGAVGSSGTVYWDERILENINASKEYKKEALLIKIKEREELSKYLRINDKLLMIKDKVVILVDDGVATGTTVLAAQKFLKQKKAKKIILATPVIAQDTYNFIEKYFDSIIALEVSNELNSVGQFYREFTQVENKEVKYIIEKHLS